jgi:hypothetical protein
MRIYYTLAEYPHDVVEIECPKCGRHGRLPYVAPSPGQVFPRGACGLSPLCRNRSRMAEPEFTEPRECAGCGCDFAALFVWDIRLAARLGPETVTNNPATTATT